jgi:hypothetical protein
MARSRTLSHVAMSVPEGTLTDEYRTRVLTFYGQVLGWRELSSLRLPDRLTIAVGPECYVNVRERPEGSARDEYQHFGVRVGSAEELRDLWDDLHANQPEVELEPISATADGQLTFRLHHLLPFAVEVQYFPAFDA